MSKYRFISIEVVSKSAVASLRERGRLNLHEEFPEIFSTALSSPSYSLRFNDSRTKVDWSCSLGHAWSSTPQDRMRLRNCPVCSGTVFITGQNDIATVTPHLSNEFDQVKNGMTPREAQAKSSAYYWWLCPEGHSYDTKYGRRKDGLGCPVCSSFRLLAGENDLQSQRPEIAKMFDVTKNGFRPDEVFDQSNRTFWWVCSLGHSFESTPNSVGSGSCRVCRNGKLLTGFNDLRTLEPTIAQEFDVVKNGANASEVLGAHGRYWWVCQNGHSWSAEVYNRARGAGCRQCLSGVITGKNDLVTFNPLLAAMYDSEQDDPVESIHREERDVIRRWICAEGHRFTGTVRRLRSYDSPCHKCDPYSNFRSRLEVAVYKELVKLHSSDQIIPNTRNLISPYEIDFYLPVANLAIEVNGTYWHSDKHIRAQHGISADEYHAMKVSRCRDLGLNTHFVWESEWTQNPEREVEKIKLAIRDAAWAWF